MASRRLRAPLFCGFGGRTPRYCHTANIAHLRDKSNYPVFFLRCRAEKFFKAPVSKIEKRHFWCYLKNMKNNLRSQDKNLNISAATRKNWQRLRTSARGRLAKFANKSCSRKKILPQEYIVCAQTMDFLQQFQQWHARAGADKKAVLQFYARKLLAAKNILRQAHVQSVLAGESCGELPESFADAPALPENCSEPDILGAIYQMMLTEGEKNCSGAYYTPGTIAEDMLKAAGCPDRSYNQILDPCCGSGSILLTAAKLLPLAPQNIYGVDNDELAVFIAKVNLLAAFPEVVFTPQIYCADYRRYDKLPRALQQKFQLIVTNPPWGAAAKGADKTESFAGIFYRAGEQLAAAGTMVFLLPEAVLNVKKHLALRKFMLQKLFLRSIKLYKKLFTGVITDFAAVTLQKLPAPEAAEVRVQLPDGSTNSIALERWRNGVDCNFSLHSDRVEELLQHIEKQRVYTLGSGLWALGIVSGNNRQMLLNRATPGAEAIFCGRDIEPYRINSAGKYIVFDRTRLQQCAPEAIYRAPEKLVYRFIAEKPVFALDDQQRLFLNSANILIPAIPGAGIKTVLALLNSTLMQFYYRYRCGGRKVLKSHLALLPIPEIDRQTDRLLTGLAAQVIAGNQEKLSEIDRIVWELYNIPRQAQEEISRKNSGNDL